MKEDIYDTEYLEELIDEDRITAQEAGLMFWYDRSLGKTPLAEQADTQESDEAAKD